MISTSPLDIRRIAKTLPLLIAISAAIAALPRHAAGQDLPVTLETDPLAPSTTPESACEGEEVDAEYCNRCHATNERLDAALGELWRVDDLLVASAEFDDSSHRKLDCLDCHAFTWPFFPHPEQPGTADLSCLDCHHGNRQTGRFDFDAINEQFQDSIHYQKLPRSFSCDSCHDPHVFRASDETSEIHEIVERSNRACTRCHLSRQAFGQLSDRRFPSLEQSHDWLPEPELHWNYVRCVECHTPDEKNFSHKVTATEHSGRFCEKCHSRDSVLLSKLYRHRVSENTDRYGFTNSIVFNDAYIIGMTRNAVMDRLFSILLVIVAVFIVGHAALRAFASRRRGKNG